MIILWNVPFKELTVQGFLELISDGKIWAISLFYDGDNVLRCDLEGNLEDEIALIEAQKDQIPALLPPMKIKLKHISMEILPLQEIIILVEGEKIEALRITIYSIGTDRRYDLEMEVDRQIDVEDLLELIFTSITPTPTPVPRRVREFRLTRDSPIPQLVQTDRFQDD